MQLAPGTYIRKYELLEKLGEGGMGEVWKAYDTELLNLVAIKRIRADLCHDAKVRSMFIREARLSFVLTHQNVCALKDAFDHESALFLVHEFVEGRTLESYLHTGAPAPSPRRVLAIIKQVLEGLAYTHRKKVIHCDITPRNIMVHEVCNEDGTINIEVKIIDFGIARALEAACRESTGTRTIVGTPLYMSPEQCQGKRVDHRSDIFSVGCVLFDLLNVRQTPESMPSRLRELPLPRLSNLPPEYDYLNDVIARATAFLPEERYASAEEFLSAVLALPDSLRYNWLVVPGERSYRITTTPVRAHAFRMFTTSWAAQKPCDPAYAALQRRIWTEPGYAWFNAQSLRTAEADDPYAHVTWWEAVAYCNWLAHCRHAHETDPAKYYPYRKDGNLMADLFPRLPSEYELRRAFEDEEMRRKVVGWDRESALREWTTDGWVAEWQVVHMRHPRHLFIPPERLPRRTALCVLGDTIGRYDLDPERDTCVFRLIESTDSL